MSEWIKGDFVPFDIGYIGKPTLPDIDPSGGGGEDSPALKSLSGGAISSDSDSSYTLSSIKDDKWGKGFICRSFTVIGGSEEFPTGSTDALRRQRSEVCLSKLAQCLIDCNVGWQLDTKRNQSVTDFTDIPTRSGSKFYPGLFFTNTISGCRLFLSYFGDEIQYNGIRDFSGQDLLRYKGYTYHGGICSSIIPEGSGSVFGDPNTETFIPYDATRICGTYYRHTFSSSLPYAAAYNPKKDCFYYYTMCATPYTIAPYATMRDDGSVPATFPASNLIYVTGRLFNTVFHDDTHVNAKYGTYVLRNETDTYESFAFVIYTDLSVFGTTLRIPCYTYNRSDLLQAMPSASISRSDGSWILGGDGSTYNTLVLCPHIEFLSKKISSFEGKYYWFPLYIAHYRNSSSDRSISEGSGIKGVIDTNLFRVSNVSDLGMFSLLDNSKFILLEQQNLLTGWDSSNNLPIDIDTTYGASVTIPEGYRIESVKSKWTFEFNTAELLSDSVIIKGKGQDEYCKGDLSSAIGLKVLPCLYIFQVTVVNSNNSVGGYRISVPPSRYTSGCPSAITETATNVNGNFFELRAYYDSSSSQAIYNAIHNSNYPSSVHYHDETDTEIYFLDLPQAFWKYEDGVFSWLGDPEDRSSLAFYYRKCVPDGTPVRIHCVYMAED